MIGAELPEAVEPATAGGRAKAEATPRTTAKMVAVKTAPMATVRRFNQPGRQRR